MSYYSQAFRDLCEDPYGEVMDVRAYVRRTDGENRLARSGLSQPGVSKSLWYESIPGTWQQIAYANSGVYWWYTEQPIGQTEKPHSTPCISYVSKYGNAWTALRYFDLGKYDGTDDPTKVSAGTITFSAIVYVLASGSSPFGLGFFNADATVTKKFKFTTNTTSRTVTGSSVIDTHGKCGYTDISDDWGGNMYHVWCSLDLDALGWNEIDLDPLFFPLGDDATQYMGSTVALCGSQIAYNYNYDHAPEPKGVYPVQGLTPVLGEPGTLIDLNVDETVLAINPIKVQRDERVGVSRASSFQLECTNLTNTAMSLTPISGAWVTVEAGFPQADEWAHVATGKVKDVTMSTEGNVVWNCYDPVKDLLDGTLKREVRFDNCPNSGDHDKLVSEIKTRSIADGSSGYNNSNGSIVNVDSTQATLAPFERRWKIKFDSVNTYNVYDEEDIAFGGPYSIASDAVVTDGTNNFFTIQSAGWTQDGPEPTYHYAIDDEFYFDTSRQRALQEVYPISIVQELIKSERFLGLFIYNAETGERFDTPFYDKTGVWDVLYNEYTQPVRGTFPAGTPIMDVIKELLRVMSASIYTMPNGQFAIFAALPIVGDTILLNGDPAKGTVEILSATAEDDARDMYNIVEVEYINPADLQLTTASQTSYRSRLRAPRTYTIDCSHLELPGAYISQMLSLTLRRVENPPRRFKVRTTLAGMGVDMKSIVAIDEPFLMEQGSALTIEKSMDIMANEVSLVSSIDDYLLDDYAIVVDFEVDENVCYVYDTPTSHPDAKKVF